MTKRKVGSIILLAAVFLVVAALGEWYRGVTALQELPLRPEPAGPAEELKTLIWTAEGGVASAEAVRLWILVDNKTKDDVHDLHFLTFETPGFDHVGPCWKEEVPICSPGSRSGLFKKAGLPPLLGKQQTAVIYASLRPRHWFGRHGASGILTWKNVAGQSLQRAVILPGVEVHSEVLDGLSGFVKAIEICALPLVVAALGLWWKRQEDLRQERDLESSTSEGR